MEDTYYCTKPQSFPKQSRNHSHFMYKAIIFAIFVYILSLFSPHSSKDQARKWELIQLFLIGIAVSYGLFSLNNDESDDNHQKLDTTDSYLSDLFKVSSFFHDKIDYQSGSNHAIEVCKSQYLKKDSLVVLEEEKFVLGNQRSNTFENCEKPLLLPVRSLKTRNCEMEETGSLQFEEKDEEISSLRLPVLSNSKPDDISKIEMKNEKESLLLALPMLSRSTEPKPHDLIRNRSDNNSTKGINTGKSVRTFRKCQSNAGVLENKGFLEEKRTQLVSERRTCLEVFDFRDYEKGVNYKNEEINCNNENGEGRDVDKKADEFIAKFREQIRLQKIESFRR